MMQNGDGRTSLLLRITEVSFALDDLRLFLDTHPDCAEALAGYETRMEKRADLLSEYGEKYGGLEQYYPGTGNGWKWNSAPMPWKRGIDF